VSTSVASAAPWDHPEVAALLDLALAEDVGAGDRTSEAVVPPGTEARGRLRAKEPLVVCGLPLLGRVFDRLGPVRVEAHVTDGARVPAGRVLATVEGDARALLAGERLVLNLLQHLSGIATATRACVDRVAGTKLVVRDTRKTIPGLRRLAKYAVRTGGGTNHRMRLDDAILVKDNHLALGGGDLAGAVRAARARWPALPLEVECRTPPEVGAAVAAAPDLILLDNMTPADLRAAVALVGGRVPLEASGGVTLDSLAEVAASGVDYVAIGALTHSVRAVDLHLKIEPLR
jgi:nicotinate-nucleotide pyrophosphorylase (carboxylating)